MRSGDAATPAASWCRGCSALEDADAAVAEVLAEWRRAFGKDSVSQTNHDTLSAASEPPVPFEMVDKVWHDWRAGNFGAKSLAQAVESFGDARLREAFELFPDKGADLFYPQWRGSLRWEKPGRPAPDEAWKASKRRGAVASDLRKAALSLRAVDAAPSGEELPGFALVFVPQAKAAQIERLARELESAIGWPESMPFLAVPTQGATLMLLTVQLPKEALPPQAFFLGPREFEEAGAEGYRLQEQLDSGNKYYTKYWQENGRTNGTVVACRQMHERGPHDVGSLLVFADPAAEAEFTHQGLGLLDAAYFKAVKLGLQTSGSAMYLGGRNGGIKQGGLLGILLQNPADSAVGLGGCAAIGPFWEVFEADASPRASVIQRVSDPASQEKDPDGRRLSVTTAEAIARLTEQTELRSTSDLWVGIPRGDAQRVRAQSSDCGEWAMYKAKQVLATGSLLLEGEGPGAEGVACLGRLGLQPILKTQFFRSCVDQGMLGHLQTTYSFERMTATPRAERPFLTLAFGGGDGPTESIRDERLYGGVGLGLAVLGASGNTIPEPVDHDELEGQEPTPPTLIHRQADRKSVV